MISEFWDKLDPGFFAPVWLLAGSVAVVAIALLEVGARRRRNQALRLFAASHLVAALTGSVSLFKRFVKRALLITSVGLLFIAMARPHLFFDWQDESRTGLDILLAVDCSKSMLTEDVKPNRLERAKLAIADFGVRLPDNRLGLIAFAGDAFLQCPLTLDHEAFEAAVRELDTDSIPRPGTDISSAIEQATQALSSQPDNMKILILVTDGEDLEARALDAAKTAAASGLKIYTVGVGTPGGGIIPERDDTGALTYHHDADGQIVQSKLDENTLRQIASLTGGAYVELGQQGEGLEEIYNHYIASLPRQHLEERREKIRIERFEWPLGLAILLLMAEFLINERASTRAATDDLTPAGQGRRIRRRRQPAKGALTAAPLIAAGLLFAGTASPARAAATDKAESDYKSGQYEDSLQNYRQALENQPDRSDLQYNRGDAAYKSGNFTEAEEAYLKALETPDLTLQEKTYYNLGNAQFRDGEAMQKVDTKKTIDLWEKALHSYDSALKLKTAADTRHNYDLVKEKLEKLKQEQQKKDQQDKNDSSQSGKNGQSGQNSQQQKQQGGPGDKQQQPQNPSGQNNPQNGNQKNQGQGDQSKPQDQPGSPGQDKTGQSPGSKDQNNTQQSAYSGGREQDKQDPGAKSRQEAEALLDSLKDDERHVNARALENGNQPPPPPASGKDW